MKIATYNILKGGPRRVHWSTMIEDHAVDLLFVQESYSQADHLPPLLFPDIQGQHVWAKAGTNTWGSAVYSTSGNLTPIVLPQFHGWVVGAELDGAAWQADGERIALFSIHAPAGEGGYAGQVNRILDEIAHVAGSMQVIIAGDFNLAVSHWDGDLRPARRCDVQIQERLAQEFGLMNCWKEANPNRSPAQTLRWSRDRTFPYHCDGIFVPARWRENLESCVVLSGDDWNILSDHNPVVVSFYPIGNSNHHNRSVK